MVGSSAEDSGARWWETQGGRISCPAYRSCSLPVSQDVWTLAGAGNRGQVPESRGSSAKRLLWSTGWQSSFTRLCLPLRIRAEALACPCYCRKPDSVYSLIEWGWWCSLCRSGPCLSRALAPPISPVAHSVLGLRSVGGASHPSPQRVGVAWTEMGRGSPRPMCLTLHRKGFQKNCVWPSGMMSAETCIFLLNFCFISYR